MSLFVIGNAGVTIGKVAVQNMSSESVTLTLNNGQPKQADAAVPVSELTSGAVTQQTPPTIFLRSAAPESFHRDTFSIKNCLKVQFNSGETRYFDITLPNNAMLNQDISIQLYGNALMLDVRGMGTYFPSVPKSQCR